MRKKMTLKDDAVLHFNTFNTDLLRQYLNFYDALGFVIVPTSPQKIPLLKKIKEDNGFLTKMEVSQLVELKTSYNIHITSDDFLVIDVDVKDKSKDGFESFTRFCRDFEINSLKFCIKTPSFGYHFYCHKECDIELKKTYKKYPGIEFLTDTFMSAGSFVKYDEKAFGFYEVLNYEDLEDNTIKINSLSKTTWELLKNLKDDDEICIKNSSRSYDIEIYTEEKLTEILSHLDSDCSRDDWFKIIAAAKSWGGDATYEALKSWSQESKKFNAKNFDATFRTTKVKTITVATLFFYLKLHDAEYFRSLKKNTYSNSSHVATNKFSEWIYILDTTEKSFYNTKQDFFCTSRKFDEICTRDTDIDDKGRKQSALMLFKQDKIKLERVHNTTFTPFFAKGIVTISDKKYFNIFDAQKLLYIDEYTMQDQKVCDLFVAALKRIAGEDYKILLKWFAHIVQNPGKILRWCPIIQGIEGSGKSVLADIIIRLLHEDYVSIINTDNLSSNFNSFSENKLVCVIEEIKISGENRHTILNKLKPFITNDILSIEHKHKDATKALNFCNFIAFTNFRDCLPLSDTSRRFAIFFDTTSKEIITEENYYAKNYLPIFDNIQSLKKSLMTYKINSDFYSDSRAPMTYDKEIMINIEKDRVDLSFEFEDLVMKNNNKFYNKFYILGNEIWIELSRLNGNFELNKQQKSNLLRLFSYSSAGTIRIDDKVHRIYVTNTKIKVQQIKLFLDKTKEQFLDIKESELLSC